MKTLEVIANELGEILDRIDRRRQMAIEILTPKVCPKCRKLVLNQDDLILMHYTGECANCDHNEFE